MSEAAFTATTVCLPKGAQVRVSGELDIAAIDPFREEMRRAREMGGPVTVDLTGLTFLGIVGVEHIAREAHELARTGRDLAIVSARPAVIDLLLRLGLGDLFRVDRRRQDRPRRMSGRS